MPLASIIIPTYNQSRYLAATLRSALSQTVNSLEVIVVDDGSTDDTREVIAPFLPQIRYLFQDNRGLAAARNSGYCLSAGQYILFLDSDDLIPADKMARHIAYLEANPQYGLAYSAWEQITPEGGRLLHGVHPGFEGDVLVPLLLRRFFFFASAAVLRRSAIEAVGLFDESLRWGEDGDFWLRLAAEGFQFGYLPEVLLHYRVHPHSMTASVTGRQIHDWMRVLEKFFASPHLPAGVRELRGEAYCVLHFETAGRFFRSGDVAAAQQQLADGAASLGRPINVDWFLEWLAGTALDARTQNPLAFVDLVMAHLPPALANLSKFRRKAIGRTYTAAVYLSARDGQALQARKNGFLAILYDPAILANRGFLRLMGRGKS